MRHYGIGFRRVAVQPGKLLINSPGSLKPLCRRLLNKTHGFNEIMVQQPALLFLFNRIRRITNITHRHNTVLQHGVFGLLYGFLNNGAIKPALLYHPHQKINHAGFFGNNAFHVAQLQVAMAVYEPGTQNSAKSRYPLPGLRDRNQINYFPFGAGN